MNQNALLGRIRELSSPLAPLETGATIHLEPIDDIDTVLFDIYGTLLISGSGEVGTAAAVDSCAAMQEALRSTGFSGDLPRAADAAVRALQSAIRTTHETARESGIDFPEVDILEIWEHVLCSPAMDPVQAPPEDRGLLPRLAIEYECRVNPVWPMPGAMETIAFFRQRGLRLGIVSNAQFYTPLILEALFGKPVQELGFDPSCCVWSYRQHRAKPAPQLFLKLAPAVDLRRAAYIGNDMLNDICTAADAGCQPILFAGDRRSLRLRHEDPRCQGIVPRATVDDLRQITEMI